MKKIETIILNKEDYKKNQQLFASTYQAYQDMVKINHDMDTCLKKVLKINQKIFNNRSCEDCLKMGEPKLVAEYEDAMKMIAFLIGAVGDLGELTEEDIKWGLEYKDRCVECNTIGTDNCSEPSHNAAKQ